VGKDRKQIKGWLVFARGKHGSLVPVRVKTNWEDAMDFGHKMLEDDSLDDEGITICVRSIPIDYFMEDLV